MTLTQTWLRYAHCVGRTSESIGGHVVPVACCPDALASEAGNALIVVSTIERNITDEFELGDLKYDENGLGRVEDAVERALIEGLRAPPFVATYYDSADGRRHFSLRSTDASPFHCGDTARALAERFTEIGRRPSDPKWFGKTFSGGGHKNAAGFTAPLGWEGE